MKPVNESIGQSTAKGKGSIIGRISPIGYESGVKGSVVARLGIDEAPTLSAQYQILAGLGNLASSSSYPSSMRPPAGWGKAAVTPS